MFSFSRGSEDSRGKNWGLQDRKGLTGGGRYFGQEKQQAGNGTLLSS